MYNICTHIKKRGRDFICEHTEFENSNKLEGDSASYFMIPSSLILDKDINNKRITVFCFCSMRRGLDRVVSFSVNSLAQWMGRKPNRNANGINSKILELIEYLQSKGFITVLNEIETAASITEIAFNIQKVVDLCQSEYFAVLYLDELQRILNYKNTISNDTPYNIDITLLTFAFLRMVIPKRQNKFRPEEINIDGTNNHVRDIEHRRTEFPEAYDAYYKDIGLKLGISERQVSTAVNALKDMGLLYFETMPRTKDDDGDWHTHTTIFCNAYKREKDCLLDAGEEYCRREINNKRRKINEYFGRRNIAYAKD